MQVFLPYTEVQRSEDWGPWVYEVINFSSSSSIGTSTFILLAQDGSQGSCRHICMSNGSRTNKEFRVERLNAFLVR